MGDPKVKLQGFGPYDNKQPLIPSFTLLAANGSKEKVSGWDYKQRNPLVVYLLPTADPEILTRLENERTVYREYKAELLAVVTADLAGLRELAARLRLSYPLLSDADALVFQKFLALADKPLPPQDTAGVFVTDRYGAATRWAFAPTPANLPDVTEIAETLDFLTNLCNP